MSSRTYRDTATTPPESSRERFAKEEEELMHLNSIDFAVIVVYLVGITAFGIWVGFRRHASTNQYFLANKSLGWFTVGAAVFTSNISTIHLVGLAAGGARTAWSSAISSGWPVLR